MYFYIKPINNNTYYNRESLEVIKNLQSLGVGATGRLSIDRQNLQIAEYNKLKQTLAPTNEQKIQEAPIQFDTMLKEGGQIQGVTQKEIQESFDNQEVKMAADNKLGATQLAKLNKLMHNIAA